MENIFILLAMDFYYVFFYFILIHFYSFGIIIYIYADNQTYYLKKILLKI